MKIQRFILALMIIMMTVVLSGCVNVTYSVTLQEEGEVDVSLSVLYNSTEYAYDNDIIEQIKGKYAESGYKIKDISDKGLKGFQIIKEDIEIDSLSGIEDEKLKIDILDDIFKTSEFKKGFLGNTYDINSVVDLTSYSNLKSYVNTDEENIISDDAYNKLLSEVNLKLVIELEKGSIISTNSTLAQNNKKVAEWVLIPGAKNNIQFEATTGDKMAITGTLIILGVVTVIALSLLAVLFRMYLKKRKNNN